MSGSSGRFRRPRRVVNLKAALICVVVAATTIVGLAALHHVQVEKTVQFLVATGDEAVAAGKWSAAMTAYDRCLQLDPVHTVRGKLAALLIEHGSGPDVLRSAWEMHESLLSDDPDNLDLRLRHAELAHRVGRFADAESQLVVLRVRRPETARVWLLSGRAAERMEQRADAIAHLERAAQLHPDDPETVDRLAHLLTEYAGRKEDAEALLADLVAAHPSGEARRVRAAWLTQQNRPQEAARDLWAALSDQPDDVRVIAMLVELSRTDRVDTSRLLNHLEQQLAVHPASPLLRIYCAHAQWQAGRRDTAIQTLRDGIARNAGETRFHELLVDFHAARNDSAAARRVFEGIPRRSLDHAMWHFLQGRVDMIDGNWPAAESHFERAAGFAGHNEPLKSRAQMCLGICRRNAGERHGAVDAFRSVVRSNPNSSSGRLGMAAAWLESGQIDLAIAEYRRLVDKDGVPALLASLLIQRAENLTRTPNWNEVERLLSDDEPLIDDPVQRTLLQAELLFARGLPAQALQHLDEAADRQADDSAIRTTTQELIADRGDELAARLKEQLRGGPRNVDMHAALLRILAQRDGASSAVSWTEELAEGTVGSNLSRAVRLRVAAQAAEAVAVVLDRLHHPAAEDLLAASGSLWQRLVDELPHHLPEAIGFHARYKPANDVIRSLDGLPISLDAEMRARCWLEALKNGREQATLRDPAERALRAFIEQSPSEPELWLAYADFLARFERYEAALLLQRQAIEADSQSAAAHSQAAWVLAVSNGDLNEARELSESAVRLTPFHPDVLAVRGLVLALSGRPQKALRVFGSIPESRRSGVSRVYEALALLEAGQAARARRLVSDVQRAEEIDRWRPADRALLESVIQRTDDATAGSVSERQ